MTEQPFSGVSAGVLNTVTWENQRYSTDLQQQKVLRKQQPNGEGKTNKRALEGCFSVPMGFPPELVNPRMSKLSELEPEDKCSI